MISETLTAPEICIVGRCAFETGIGQITFSFCEVLARNFPISILPVEPHLRSESHITLPNGRIVPVCRERAAVKVWIFTDVLWNGAYDRNYLLIPQTGLRLAYPILDSDRFPLEWVNILNDRFDAAIVACTELECAARSSGVTIPIVVLPLALDLDPLLARPFLPANPSKIRFLSIAAFHPRKNHQVVIEAFAQAFAERSDVELILHSNLEFTGTLASLNRLIDRHRLSNVTISTGRLSELAKMELIESCDVFVNCSSGEGYSIPPREALALGKTLVLSNVGGQKDLAGIPGVFLVDPRLSVPARYPEIDNRIIGNQTPVSAEDVARTLFGAHSYVANGEYLNTRGAARISAMQFSFSRLSTSYAELIDTSIRDFRRHEDIPATVIIPDEYKQIVEPLIGKRASSLSHVSSRVIPAHDAGFFSLFNVFISHLVWDLRDHRIHRVLPDWDVARLIGRLGTDKFSSFCYGTPTDGNIWTTVFEPLFGLTDDEMSDERILYSNSVGPDEQFNAYREPLLTYIHAYRLYEQKEFDEWRRQYNSVVRDHVRLRPQFAHELDEFTERNFADKFMLAAHVRHPSHAIEQPTAKLAYTQSYIDRITVELSRRGIKPSDTSWGLFLATDQERTVQQFVEVFGEHVACFPDVRRTRISEDLAFDALPEAERKKEGYQVQHLAAASKASWSSRMMWEVVRDAMAMARCEVLFHVVSNISTAVAYLNPNVDLRFVK